MESNKDEAERCIEIAKSYIQEKDYERAIRILEKSKRLYPLPKATELLERIETEKNGSSSSSSSSSNGPTRRSNPSSTSSSSSSGSESPSVTYTEEQVELVRRVKKSKDYYEILMVAKETTVEEIKRNYKKIALKMHPDKNRAPGAEEAFKSVNQAFACLSDPEKRRLYDEGGERYLQRAQSYPGSRGGGGGAGGFYYSEEMTPEELFEIFFGLRRPGMVRRSASGGGRTQHSRGGGGGGGGGGGVHVETAEFSFKQLIPMLIFLIFAVVFSSSSPFFNRESNYSQEFQLSPTRYYSVKRMTVNLGIPYFVRSSFDTSSGGSGGGGGEYQEGSENFRRFEEFVEKTWLRQTQNQCYFEQQQKQRLEDHLRWTFDSQKRARIQEKIDSFQMPNCDMWKRVHNAQRHTPATA